MCKKCKEILDFIPEHSRQAAREHLELLHEYFINYFPGHCQEEVRLSVEEVS